MYSTRVFSAFATALQEATATRSPVLVAQLALPALIKAAATLPFDDFRCLRANCTGAACTTLRVNTAAAFAGNPAQSTPDRLFPVCEYLRTARRIDTQEEASRLFTQLLVLAQFVTV